MIGELNNIGKQAKAERPCPRTPTQSKLKMLKKFKYTDLKQKTSQRTVYPLGIKEDKMFCVDLSEYTQEEIDDFTCILDAIHQQAIAAIKEVGLGSNFRYFFFSNME